MAKIFEHAVIYNGVFYPPNTPIEDEEVAKNVTTEKAVVENDKRTVRKSKSRTAE